MNRARQLLQVLLRKEAQSLPVVSLFLVPLIFFPWVNYSFTQGKELSFKLFVIFALFSLLFYILKGKTLTWRNLGNSTLFILLFLQLAWHGFTDFLSDNALVSIFGTFSRGEGFIMELYGFVFLTWNALFLKRSEIQTVLKFFWVSSCIVALYAILQKLGVEWFFQDYATNLFQGRVFSFSGNPSLLGQLLLLSVITGIFLFVNGSSKKSKVVYLLGNSLLLLGIFFSGTRAALLGLGLSSVLLVLRYYKELWNILKKLTWKGKTVIAAGFAGVILLGLLGAPEGRFDLSQLSLRSLESRFTIWEGVGTLIKEHWLLGYGQETLYVHFPEVINESFYTLEENINISVDRAHNEILEEWYSHGIFAVFIYLALLYQLFKVFFTQKDPQSVFLSAILIGNCIQNQLAFQDPAITVVVSFVWGSLVASQTKEGLETSTWAFKGKRLHKWVLASTGLLALAYIAYTTFFVPLQAHLHYSAYKNTATYDKAVEELKTAIEWAPHFSELWYELIFLDPSSMGRALANLEKIDVGSGDLLAWYGNYYAETNPQLSADYFLSALTLNTKNPNWIRAFGDMLYDNGDCETASYLYAQYLEVVPDYWEWAMDLESRTEIEQKSFETFFKHVPYFWGTLEKMQSCEELQST